MTTVLSDKESVAPTSSKEEKEEIGWYPNNPNQNKDGSETVIPTTTTTTTTVIPTTTTVIPRTTTAQATVATSNEPPATIPSNFDTNLKFTPSLWWSNDVTKERKERLRRVCIADIEIRTLTPPHFLAGEKGVFATKKFERCDIVGEYTGRVVNESVNGHYVAALEDKTLAASLGVDAGDCGNELRYINSYLNVNFFPNVTMRTGYVNSMPHILVICLRDIEIGEELLLDYGEAYNDAYLRPKPVVHVANLDNAVVRHELPGYGSDSSRESIDEKKEGESK